MSSLFLFCLVNCSHVAYIAAFHDVSDIRATNRHALQSNHRKDF